jgi:hypothetical protein
MKHLAESAHWQQELSAVEYVQQQLQFEMPLLGRPMHGQLDALLPDIFERAAHRNSRWQAPTGGTQTLFCICAIFIVLMIVPFVLHNPSANASANFTQEVPLATNTAVSSYKKDTMEARYTSGDEDATQEPVVLPNLDVGERSENEGDRNLMSASPVPAPGGTAIASLEAQR